MSLPRIKAPEPSQHAVRLPSPLPVRMAFRGAARELRWSTESLDLVDVAAAVFIADRSVRRHMNRPRRLRLRLPVRRPSLWRNLAPELEDVLAFLTHDRFELEFYAATRTPLTRATRSRAGCFARVALFSGGLDSACAAAVFARDSSPTVFVSHYVTGIHRLEELLRTITGAYDGDDVMPHAGFFVAPAPGVARTLGENSRRSRSFLFASLALATAAGVGAREIAICENGPLALNLPLSPAMVPTRHAHSRFLLGMQRLGRRLFGAELRVVNPFELQTKAEMTRVFANHPGLALETISCWNQQWSGRGRLHGRGHCGFCLPCLVRNVALTRAGIVVPRGHFDVNVSSLVDRRRKTSEDHDRLAAFRLLVGFARELEACSNWKSFLQRFPDVIDTHPTSTSLQPEEWYASVFRMMHRFGREIAFAFLCGEQATLHP